MLFEVLAGALFVLAVFDCWQTKRQIHRYGPEFELNSRIAKTSKFLSAEVASVLWIMIPTLLWVLAARAFNATWFLALLVGLRLRFFWIQASSLIFEKQLREYLIRTGKYKPKVGDDSNQDHPPLDSAKAPSSPSPTLFQKGKKWLSSLKQMLTRQ
jgi:hypothetical protein